MENTELAMVPSETPEVNHMRMSRLENSLFSKELAPHYMKLAGQLASSEMVPKCFRGKPQDLFICWSMGYQIGVPPEQAMQCIAVVNGKATMWGDEMLALCMSHPDFEDIEEHPIRSKDDTITGYICTVFRRGRKPKSSEFTLDMAKKAGLLAKGGVWNQYPERMLKLRARGFALRDTFPDALKGIKSREEVEDYIDADYTTKPSRTEQLKQQLTIDKDITHVDAIYGSTPVEENYVALEEAVESDKLPSQESPQEQAAALHSQIKQLIDEKHIAEERIVKALAYYEVEHIEELSIDQAKHFIKQLSK